MPPYPCPPPKPPKCSLVNKGCVDGGDVAVVALHIGTRSICSTRLHLLLTQHLPTPAGGCTTRVRECVLGTMMRNQSKLCVGGGSKDAWTWLCPAGHRTEYTGSGGMVETAVCGKGVSGAAGGPGTPNRPPPTQPLSRPHSKLPPWQSWLVYGPPLTCVTAAVLPPSVHAPPPAAA